MSSVDSNSHQARIQEFSFGGGGGSNLSKKIWQAKKKKKKKRGEGGRFSIYFALVWSKSNIAIETVLKTITFS